eukprot:3677763-Amphidinium_carterae.2
MKRFTATKPGGVERPRADPRLAAKGKGKDGKDNKGKGKDTPAKTYKACFNCGKKVHLAKDCWSKPQGGKKQKDKGGKCAGGVSSGKVQDQRRWSFGRLARGRARRGATTSSRSSAAATEAAEAVIPGTPAATSRAEVAPPERGGVQKEEP